MRKPLALAVVSLLALGACSDSSTTHPSTTTTAALSTRIAQIRRQSADGSISFASFLRPVGDCDALLDHLRAEAAARVGPYGLPGLGGVIALEGAATAGAGTRDTARAPSAPTANDSSNKQTAGANHSTTNNQESGVDEPDIVKTDGRRIVAIAENRLSVVSVDGATASTPRTLRLGGASWAPGELLVHGDRALVFGTSWTPEPAGTTARTERIAVGTTRATVTEVDLSGTGTPVIRRTLEIDGSYLTGRLVGSTARVVVRSEPQQLPFVTPQGRSGEERARRSNEQVVLESTIEDWLPSFTLRDGGGTVIDSGRLTDCENVDAPSEFAGFGSLSVLTFDLTQPLGDGDAVSILAGGDTVYASEANLYVATQTWVDPDRQNGAPRWANDFATSIHQFGIEGAGAATYLASGTVPGYLLNQFSMSEHEGVLRAATTMGVPWGAGSVSRLTTLRRSGDQLRHVGQVGDLGKGERIYSVRYAGDVAYLVTFRQTDPFYTVDLADPAAPKVLGELKITGYSGYLHPIADDLVIGVGQEATTEGRVQGTKVSLFDVSDLARPAELAKWVVPGSTTGVEVDHKAFLWWPATKTLVLPLNQWGATPVPMPMPTPAEGGATSGSSGISAPSNAPASDQGFHGAVVLKVDRATGIGEQGRISHRIEKPANLGETDCRVVPAGELGPRAKEMGTVPDGMLVLICGPGATGGAVGYSCNRIDDASLRSMAPDSPIVVPDGGWIEYCWASWNQPNPIARSLVIGTHLWTMSTRHLQANDLSTLTQGARVVL